MIGDIVAADGQQADGGEPALRLRPASLSLVKDVLSGIEVIAKSLPGGGATGLEVGFSGTKLRVRDAVSLPQLPLGLGYIQGISLDLGFDVDILAKTMSFNVGVGSDQNPFTWLASPLAGNGLLQLGAGEGGLGVSCRAASASAGHRPGDRLGQRLGVLAAQLDTTKTPFGVMVLLTGNASVDVLDGLASASLTLTAGLGIQVSPGPLDLLYDYHPAAPRGVHRPDVGDAVRRGRRGRPPHRRLVRARGLGRLVGLLRDDQRQRPDVVAAMNVRR